MVTHKTVTKLLPIPGISNTYVLFTGNGNMLPAVGNGPLF